MTSRKLRTKTVICKGCNEEKLHEAKGLCQSCYEAKRRLENKNGWYDKKREATKKWQKEHPELCRKQRDNWKAKNPVLHRLLIKIWELRNPDKVMKSNTKWRLNHPDMVYANHVRNIRNKPYQWNKQLARQRLRFQYKLKKGSPNIQNVIRDEIILNTIEHSEVRENEMS